METKKGGIFYGWWIVVVCTLIMATFFTLLLSCISLFIVPITEDLGITRSAFGVFSTILMILGMILSPIAGKICATKNTRTIMSAALLLGVVGNHGRGDIHFRKIDEKAVDEFGYLIQIQTDIRNLFIGRHSEASERFCHGFVICHNSILLQITDIVKSLYLQPLTG